MPATAPPAIECGICYLSADTDPCDVCSAETQKPKRRSRLTPEERQKREEERKAAVAERKQARIEAKLQEKAERLSEALGETYQLPAAVGRKGQVLSVTPKQALGLVRKTMADHHGALTVDVEHSGYPLGHANYELRLVQLGSQDWSLVFDPIEHTEEIRALLAEATTLHAWYANADLVPLAHAGLLDIDAGWDKMHDPVINYRLDDPEGVANGMGLKKVAPTVLGEASVVPDTDEARSAAFKAGGWGTNIKVTQNVETSGWAQIPKDSATMIRYAAGDVLDTAALAARAPRVAPELLSRERLGQHMVSRITYAGWPIDYGLVVEMHESFGTSCAEYTERVNAFGIANPGSPLQVKAGFEGLGIALPEHHKTGKPTTDKQAMKQLARDHAGSDAAELAELMLLYRKESKLISSFFAPFRSQCEHGDGRTRPTILTLGANTGRMSCRGPNLQQMPKKGGIRNIIRADPGHVLISADFSGVEVRGAAALSGDQMLLEQILNENSKEQRDLHWTIARMAFGAAATKDHRGIAKGGVFGHIYGGGARTLAINLGITEEKMREIIAALEAITPQFATWSRELKNQVEHRGLTEMASYSGRVIHFDKHKAHKAVNYLIQGSCREILVDALMRWSETKWGSCTLLPVHDEIIVQVPEEDGEEATKTLLECMTSDFMGVPIIAEADPPSCFWAEGGQLDKQAELDNSDILDGVDGYESDEDPEDWNQYS